MKQNLIDVDKLWADIEYWENHAEPGMEDYDTRDIDQVVGFQPLVDAIPVEYIKKKLKKLDSDINYAWYVGNEMLDQLIYAKAWVEEVLLKDWEKEKWKDSGKK